MLAADAVTGKVVKVLPFFLDAQGRIAKSPSLFDRDVYQAYLREHTNEVSVSVSTCCGKPKIRR